MGNLRYKGYVGSVEYSEPDNCLYGKVLGISKHAIIYEGATLDELKTDFEAGIDHYLEVCKANNMAPEPAYSGSLTIRVSPEIHGQLAVLAQKMETSINNLIRNIIVDFTKHENLETS